MGNNQENSIIEKTKYRPEKKEIKTFLIDLIFLLTGCISGGFASIGILIPNGLTSGGLTGIVRIIMSFCDVSFSVIYYALAVFIFVLGWIFLGKREARNIILLTFMYPSVVFVMERIPNLLLLEESDLILAAIYFAVFDGISTGLILTRGYSFGGTDTIAKIIKKKLLPYVDMSKILLALNAVVVLASALVYGRNIALYALVMIVISTKVMDVVMFGLETKIVKVEVISNITDDIAAYIMNELERGVSIDTTIGAYTGAERKRLIVYCSPRESMIIRQFVAKHDAKALVTVLHIDTVWGDGFKAIDKE